MIAALIVSNPPGGLQVAVSLLLPIHVPQRVSQRAAVRFLRSETSEVNAYRTLVARRDRKQGIALSMLLCELSGGETCACSASRSA